MESVNVKYSLPIGTVLNNGQYPYRVEEVLGRGSYGITYKVSSKILIGNITRKVYFAIKECFTKSYCRRDTDGVTMLYDDESVIDDLRDFLSEGKMLAKMCMDNNNIVHVNETFEENNTAYYVMEYLEGGNLNQLIRRKGTGVSEQEALHWMLPIVEAVACVHQHHFNHLDIKPENIMIRKDEEGNLAEPVLIDFGVTLHFNRKGKRTATSKDRYVGCSEGYSPIEQYLGITSFTPEADVYALGATLYFLLIGKDPEKASTIQSRQIDKVLSGKVSGQTMNAIISAMKPMADERTKTVKDFYANLKGKKVGHIVDEDVTKEELDNGTIVKGGYVDYLIVGLQSKGDNYIKYKAIRYAGEQLGANVTLKVNYTIYEYFVKGTHNRKKGSKVEANNPDEKSRKKFLQLATKKTGLTLGNNAQVADGSHAHEIFQANGTLYFVVKDGSKIEKSQSPKPPHPVPDSNPLKWKRIGLTLGVVIILSLLVGGGLQKCTNTSSVNADTLEIDAVPEPNDIDTAKIIMPSVLIKQPAQENPASSKQERETPAKVEQPKETNEQIYNRALKNSDWGVISTLAKGGYTLACGALARHYLANSENHSQAYYWAQRASNADRQYVMDILEKYGFLVNGKPVIE